VVSAWRALALGVAWALVAGCGMQPRPPSRAALRVVASPETARVFVDDRFIATSRVLAQQPLVLAPGRHLLTLEASGHFPHDLEIELPIGETTVEVELRPIPQ
jgi:hypothetical protein